MKFLDSIDCRRQRLGTVKRQFRFFSNRVLFIWLVDGCTLIATDHADDDETGKQPFAQIEKHNGVTLRVREHC